MKLFCSFCYLTDKKHLETQGIMCPNSSFVGGCDSNYDHNVNPTAEGETSHAAMRTFHQKIQNEQNFYDRNWKKVSSLPLSQTILNVGLVCKRNNELIRGMIKDPIRTSFGYPKQLTDGLFGDKCGVGQDLFGTDIMRGRDHGLQPYTVRYSRCMNKTINSWNDLNSIFGVQRTKLMQNIYKNIHNIDLLTGLMAELPTYGLGGGPVFACLWAEQFKRLKDGDRFFFAHTNTPCAIRRTKGKKYQKNFKFIR